MREVLLSSLTAMSDYAPAVEHRVSCVVTNSGGSYGPAMSRPTGKVRDTAKAPKPRKRERRSARHTQRRRR